MKQLQVHCFQLSKVQARFHQHQTDQRKVVGQNPFVQFFLGVFLGNVFRKGGKGFYDGIAFLLVVHPGVFQSLSQLRHQDSQVDFFLHMSPDNVHALLQNFPGFIDPTAQLEQH